MSLSYPIFVNAGFNDPLQGEIAARALYVADGIRTGFCVNDEHDRVSNVVTAAALHFHTAIVLVGGWDWRLPDGTQQQRRQVNLEPYSEHLANQCRDAIDIWTRSRSAANLYIDFGNELDLSYWKSDLNAYHRTAMESYERVRSMSPDVNFITGSTMNFNKGFSWKRSGYEVMEDICDFNWPEDTWQGLHPYRDGRLWPSFDSDTSALAAFRKMLAGRRPIITEMGWPSGEGNSDETISEYVRLEIEMWRDFVAPYTHYQIQDGPMPNNVGAGGFGAYTNEADGLIAKPVEKALRSAKIG